MPTLSRLAKLASGIAVIGFLGWLVMCNRASAQPASACLPADTWLTMLADDYGERPAVAATMGQGAITFTANPETGTWSMLIASGPRLCMIAGGKNWKPADAPVVVPNKAPEIYTRPNRNGFGYVVISRPA